MPSKHQSEIEAAKAELAAQNLDKAVQILEAVLKADPTNTEARALLAKALVFTDPQRSEEQIQSLEGTDFYDLGVALQTMQRLFKLADQPDQLPDSPVKALYLEAIHLLKNRHFTEALDKFIEVVEEQRTYDDDGARKACIAIFNYLGHDDVVVRDYRAKLSRAMYV